MLIQKRLKELLIYTPANGLWIRRATIGRHGCHRAGKFVGHQGRNGYISIRIDGKLYLAHRLAFLYMTGKWPAKQVDHKNLNPSDNRWKNLREASHGQNVQNGSTRRSKSGMKGAHFHRGSRKNPYRARITVNNKEKHLGCFASKEAAHAAYFAAAKKHFGEFARAK